MDKIFFQKLRFYAYHGALIQEQEQGQYFELDLELTCDLELAGTSDQLTDSVDYGQLYNLIKAVATTKRFHLLEALGEHLCRELFKQFPKIEGILLRLRKPEAPLEQDPITGLWQPGLFGAEGCVGIELYRRKKTIP